MATEAALGAAALSASDYPSAVLHLTKAITSSSTNTTISPQWLIHRSTAYQRTKQPHLSLRDAERAVLSAEARGRRELIGTAHFRRAVAYHGLGEFGNARMCMSWCRKYNDKERGLGMWQAKITQDYENAGGEDAECNKVTTVEKPVAIKEEDSDEIVKGKGKGKEAVRHEPIVAKPAAPAVREAPVPVKPAGTTVDKIRVEWYQSNTSVTIEILCKGIPVENAKVMLEEGQLLVKFPVTASNTDYEYNATPLHQKIDAEKSSFRVTPHKMEISLVKLVPGLKWSEIFSTAISTESDPAVKVFELQKPLSETTLESNVSKPETPLATCTPAQPDTEGRITPEPDEPNSSTVGPAKRITPLAPATKTTASAPAAKKPKNWDAVLKDEDSDEEENEMNKFFKMLYKDADPDSKRAMMKSYQESNGTSLSTNWAEAKDKTYLTEPPEGVEAKKWS